jgi:hypothetical protein
MSSNEAPRALLSPPEELEFGVSDIVNAPEVQSEPEEFDRRVMDNIRTRIMWVKDGSPYVEIADMKGVAPGEEPASVQNVAMPPNVNMYDEQKSPFFRPGLYME